MGSVGPSDVEGFLEGVYRRSAARGSPSPIANWIAANRIVTDEGAYPGPWDHDRVRPSLEPLQAFGDPNVRLVCVLAPVQMMKTEILLNIALYSLYCGHQILLFEPDKFLAEEIMKTRLRPVIEQVPELAEQLVRHTDYKNNKIGKEKSYDTSTLIRMKSGARITSLSPAMTTGLSSRSPRVVLVDEVSKMARLPLPELLGRLTSWKDRGKIVLVSSPGDEGSCETTKIWQQGSQGIYHGRCPECGEYTPLTFDSVKVPLDAKGSWVIDEAHFEALCCKARWSEVDRLNAIREGRWVHKEPDHPWRTYRTTGFASPFTSVELIMDEGHRAREKMRAVHDPTDYKIWTQERLAQAWDETVAGVSIEFAKSLTYRLPDGKGVLSIVPNDVMAITCGMDVGAAYVCGEFVGWGVAPNGAIRSWGLGYFTLHGSINSKGVWSELERHLDRAVWQREDGRPLRLSKALIDCSYMTPVVKGFCVQMASKEQGLFGQVIEDQQYGWALLPCRGDRAAVSIKFLVRTLGRTRYPPNEVIVGGSMIKNWIYDAFAVSKTAAGAAYRPMNFPSNMGSHGYDDAYFDSLTNEQRYPHKDRNGRIVMQWRKIRQGRPNEGLDCRVYAKGALAMMAGNGSIDPAEFLRALQARFESLTLE